MGWFWFGWLLWLLESSEPLQPPKMRKAAEIANATIERKGIIALFMPVA